ncbi:MAG: FmdB family zinc ribbon protein [Dehalococcoidia bacterium]
MPLFEYRCEDCQQVNTLLVYSWTKETDHACSSCGSGKLNKMVSRFSFRRSWGDSLNWVPSGETLRDVNEDDPAHVDQFMGRIKHEMGGQVTSDFEEMRREAQSGPRSFDHDHGHDHGHSH